MMRGCFTGVEIKKKSRSKKTLHNTRPLKDNNGHILRKAHYVRKPCGTRMPEVSNLRNTAVFVEVQQMRHNVDDQTQRDLMVPVAESPSHRAKFHFLMCPLFCSFVCGFIFQRQQVVGSWTDIS